MRFFKKLVSSVLITLLLVSNVLAADIREVDVGDVYFLYRLTGANAAVQVVRVDIPNNRVKIRYRNGVVDWVRPGDLMSQTQSDNADTATNLGVALGIGAIIACSLDPECGKKR